MLSYDFELPEVGEGVIEAELIKWFVDVGDAVADGQPVCEIMTDKATMEINCPRSGVVTGRFGEEGEVISVHTKILTLDQNAAVAPKPETKAPAPVKTEKSAPPKSAVPKTQKKPQPVAKKMPSVKPATKTTDKVLASPATRLFASEKGVDLGDLAWTGKGGRITKNDVLASLETTNKIISPPALQTSITFGEDEVVKITGLRRKIAEKMVDSVQRAPHFTYVDEVDATDLVALRSSLKNIAMERGVKLTYIPFIMKALVSVFREFPTANAVMDEENFALQSEVR